MIALLHTIKSRHVHFILLACALGAFHTAKAETLLDRKTKAVTVYSGDTGQKPNVVIIQTDDLGYDDLGINGNQGIETPSLDQLARESVQFSQFNVASVCAPTRASLLTGRDFWRTGVSGVHAGKDFLNLDETTFGDVFRSHGYTTGMWGKWHSGKTDGYFPWDRGFDEAFYARLYHYQNNKGLLNGVEHQTSGWVSRAIADFTIDFIQRNKDKPFLAYVSFLAPHTPWQAPEWIIKKYTDKGFSRALATVYAMIDQVDQQSRRILQAIDDNGLRNNTIVMFMSDNGPERQDRSLGWLNDNDWSLRNNHGLRGKKGQSFENGLRSSLFIRYPQRFNPATVNRLVDVTDIYPTLLDIVGISNTGSKNIDGRSIKPYLEGNISPLSDRIAITSQWHPFENGSAQEHNPVVNKQGLKFEDQNLAIRNERHRLSYFWGGKHLYDLSQDPRESNNLYYQAPSLVEELKAPLRAWFDGIKNTGGSFNAPLFKIGLHGKQKSHLKAYGPYKVQGNVQNRSHKIEGFKNKGDASYYRLEIVTEGRYRIALAHASAGNGRFNIEIGGQYLNINVQGGTWSSSGGTMNLKPGIYDMKVQLDTDGQVFNNMTEIHFERI